MLFGNFENVTKIMADDFVRFVTGLVVIYFIMKTFNLSVLADIHAPKVANCGK